MATIVICDDDRHYFELTAAFLRCKGHSVLWAKDPTDLYLVLKGLKPDLVILDTQMPEGGGPMAQKMLDQKYGTGLPTLICSGIPVEHQKQWFPPRPNRRYIGKPAKVEQIGALVDELIAAPPAPSP